MDLSIRTVDHTDGNALDLLYVATSGGVVGPHGETEHLHGRNVGSLAVGRTGVWALVDKRELHHLDGRGSRLVAAIDSGSGVCLHVHGDVVYVGGDGGSLWRLGDRELLPVRSFEDAPSRNEWYTPWGGPPSVFSMADDGANLYVSVHVGGILASDDNGHSWRVTIDLHDDVHQVAVRKGDGTLFAATGMNGLAESSDGGRSWFHHTRGLHGTYLLAAAVSSQGVLVGASSGPSANDGAVYLFDGERFAPVEGLPGRLHGAVGPRRIVADGDHAALIDPDGNVHVSDDGGRRWRNALGPLPSPSQPLLRSRNH